MNFKVFIELLFAAILTVVTSASFAPAPDLIWKEGEEDPQTGLVINELLICNAPEGLDWDLWGYFYRAPSLPCKTVEGSMAQMHMFSGSFWRVEPTHAGDTVVLKYVDKRKKHSYAPHGFNIKFRKSGKTIQVPVRHHFQPCESTVHPYFPLVETAVTDIVPAVKNIVHGKGCSAIRTLEEHLVDGIRPEGYRLTVSDGKAIVEASDNQGLRYGRITLEKFKENAGSDILPDMVVEDWPDLPYRAQMIDVSRLYFSLEELKSLVNVLERCKVNTLALHLNDDESWRLEIDGLPELTSYGAFHALPDYQEDGTYVCHDGIHPINGSALGKVWGGTSGYYSRKDFIDFIQYAHNHGVRVVPELDIPGHCYSAVEAMKYRERATGDSSFRLVDPDDTSSYCSLQGYSGNVIDIALPSVFNFLGKVFDSIVSMYAEAGVPLEEIAVGGDEVAEGAWEGSPSCRALMEEKGYTSVEQVRGDFFRKVNAMLRERGVRISGYHEIVQGINDEIFSEIAENCGHIIVWLPLKYTDHTHLAYTLANRGMNVVMSMGCHLYFDNTRSMSWDERGLTWAGTLDERKVFTFLPFNVAASNRFDNYNNPCDLSALKRYVPELERPENIAGMQPMIWCSNIWKSEDAFEMVLPKAYGAWERGWNARPAWEQGTKAEDPAFEEDFLRFYTVVRKQELPFLDEVGLNYWTNDNLRYRNILVRDFRTVWQGEVINYNIGTAAHCPGTLSSLRKSLPVDVKMTVWADTLLSPELAEMMKMGFPDIPIVYGSLSNPSPELMAAVESSDLCLVSSGSGIARSVRESLEQYRTLTGKPVAAYAIGYGKSLGKTISTMEFCWFRDEKALLKAQGDGVSPCSGYAPDAVFDFEISDEAGAEAFLKKNSLEEGEYLCCIPGFRHTPTWEFYGTGYNEKKDFRNQQYQSSDNEILRAVVCEAVRKHNKKVLICAEQIPELRLCREEIYDKLPKDVRKRCVFQTELLSPQLALGVYKRSLCVFGIEMHSQVMAAGNGVPACIFYHSGFGSKADMFNTVGLGDWLLDIDSEGAQEKAVQIVSEILTKPSSAKAKLLESRNIIDRSRNNAISKSFYF